MVLLKSVMFVVSWAVGSDTTVGKSYLTGWLWEHKGTSVVSLIFFVEFW